MISSSSGRCSSRSRLSQRLYPLVVALCLCLSLQVQAQVIGSDVKKIEAKKCPKIPAKNSITATVTRVVDGDTVKVKYRGKLYSVRMLTIDTPETKYYGKEQEYWGPRATNHLKKILPEGERVEVEFEEEACDRYVRLLGHVWYKGRNMNRAMLESGLAVNYCIYPNIRHCRDYAGVVQQTMAEEKGIFGDKDFELPYIWRRKISERKPSKYVGNIFDYQVYTPGNLDRVPVSDRIFFMKKSHVRQPYEMAD